MDGRWRKTRGRTRVGGSAQVWVVRAQLARVVQVEDGGNEVDRDGEAPLALHLLQHAEGGARVEDARDADRDEEALHPPQEKV